MVLDRLPGRTVKYHTFVTLNTPTWLPDRHLNVAAMLAHVDELVAQIGDLLFSYLGQPDRVVRLSSKIVGSTEQVIIEDILPIPRKIPLLTADALNTLRNAIEHTLFAEYGFHNGQPIDENLARSIQMPAKDTYDGFSNWVLNQPKKYPAAARAGGELVRRIELLQPFQRTVSPDLHPLSRLVSYTNHSKHRAPAITAVHNAATISNERVPRTMPNLPTSSDTPLRLGDIVDENPIGTRRVIEIYPYLGINLPGTGVWSILLKELEHITEWVRKQAVPILITGNTEAKPPLPNHFDIRSGARDERERIATGSLVSAADGVRDRFSAASLRPNMADQLAKIDSAINRDRVVSWLDNLTDQEVIDRHSRIEKAIRPRVMPKQLEARLREILDEINGQDDTQMPAED